MKHYLFFISQPYSFGILRPLQHVIRQRGGEAAWFFDGPGEKFLHPDEIKLGSFAEVKKYNPRAVFVPGNRVFDFFPGVKVQIFHGFSVDKRSAQRGHFRIRGFFDLYCTQGPDTTARFKELEKKYQYFKVNETGWPKMDALFRHQPKIDPNERPEILLTSTFTPTLSAAREIFETVRLLSRNDKYHWTVNFHPRMDTNIIDMYRSISNNNLCYVETDDVIPLLLKADVMVSDTSSIIAEFMLLHKPVVTFKNKKPGPYHININSNDQLESAIQYALSKPTDLIIEIKNYAQQIHPYRDGRSSERVIDATEYFIEHEFENMPSKPLNLFRKLKMRKRVGYFHWK